MGCRNGKLIASCRSWMTIHTNAENDKKYEEGNDGGSSNMNLPADKGGPAAVSFYIRIYSRETNEEGVFDSNYTVEVYEVIEENCKVMPVGNPKVYEGLGNNLGSAFANALGEAVAEIRTYIKSKVTTYSKGYVFDNRSTNEQSGQEFVAWWKIKSKKDNAGKPAQLARIKVEVQPGECRCLPISQSPEQRGNPAGRKKRGG